MNPFAMDSVKISLEFFQPVQALWKAWTDPSIVMKWFGSDPAGVGVAADINVSPNGSYEITFADSNGTDHTCFGTYSRVEEFQHLAFSWEWKSEPGHVSQVSIRFRENGGSTIMEFEHFNLSPDSLHGYAEGWAGTFRKLRAVLIEKP